MKSFLPIFILFILFVPAVVFGQATLINLPNGLNPNNGFDSYINTLYALSISIAALLAVIKIVIAGVKWMTTDIVTSKGDAKKDIQAAVLGLLVIIGAVLIIEVINPDIGTVDLKFDPVSARDDGRPPAQDRAVAICSSYSGGCSIITCDTSGTISCANAETVCESQPTFVSIQNAGPNTLVCQTSITPNTGIDSTGSDVFSEENITTETALTTENSREAYERILAEQTEDGASLVYRIGVNGFNGTAVEQRQIEQTCKDRGGTSVVYILSPTGNYNGGMCLN